MNRTKVELQLKQGFSVLRMVNKNEDVSELENDVAIIIGALRLLYEMQFETAIPDEDVEETKEQIKELLEKFQALM